MLCEGGVHLTIVGKAQEAIYTKDRVFDSSRGIC